MSKLTYDQKGQPAQWSARRQAFGYYPRIGAAVSSCSNLLESEPRVSPADGQQFAERDQGTTALRTMTGPHFGIIPRWAAGLGLTGAQHRVLLAIACHARKEARIARLSIQQIAKEVHLDRRSVQRAIRRLEARRVLKQLRGGGRFRGSHAGSYVGRANEYQIIFTRPTDTTNSVDDAASGAEDAEYSGNDVPIFVETAACLDLNSGLYAAPTESVEQKEEETPPAGESRAHARGAGFSHNCVDEEQGSLLPIKDGSEYRLAALKAYNPGIPTIQFAVELGVNARDPHVLGKFIDWHIEHNNLPGNFEAMEAAYRNWIRNEPKFAARHNAHGSRKPPGRSRLVESALNRARAYDG